MMFLILQTHEPAVFIESLITTTLQSRDFYNFELIRVFIVQHDEDCIKLSLIGRNELFMA